MKKYFQLSITLLITSLILATSLRGIAGNFTELNASNEKWISGPLELSPERGRFALLVSIIENKSLFFSDPIARFALPDLGYKNGHYVSLFAPGVSYLVAPGYLLGRIFSMSQVGTFAMIAIFSVINMLLIWLVSKYIGVNSVSATIAGLVFIFATPAFTYGVTLYQHHISTLLILLSIYILLRWNNIKSLCVIWFLCAASIPIDYPNLFLMFPIGIYALGRIVYIKSQGYNLDINVRLTGILTFIGFVLPIIFFCWFNKASYNNPFQFSGTVAGVRAIDESGKPAAPTATNPQDVERYINPNVQKKSAVGFFKTRDLLNGFYIHLISSDRGVLYFAPVILLGIFGAAILYQKKQSILPVLVGIIGANLFLYSMWGDPWGGWAFGSRYLIPSYAIMAILLGVFLSKFRRNILVIGIFSILFLYSSAVNTLGALTSSANPPQAEVLALEKQSGMVQKYTYERNWDYLMAGNSKSFVFQTIGNKYLKSWQYYYLVLGVIDITVLGLIVQLVRKNEN